MELLIFAIFICGCFFLVRGIKMLLEWVNVLRYSHNHQGTLVDAHNEVSKLLNERVAIDKMLDKYSSVTDKYVDYATEKYKDYGFSLARAERNRELRRYFASKNR